MTWPSMSAAFLFWNLMHWIVSKTTIVVIVTYLTLIMGELVPKRIGMGYAERVSCWLPNR